MCFNSYVWLIKSHLPGKEDGFFITFFYETRDQAKRQDHTYHPAILPNGDRVKQLPAGSH